MEKNNQPPSSAKNFFWGAMIGAVAGFALGILYAPDEGGRTRKAVEEKKKELLKKAEKIKKEVEPIIKKVGEAIEPVAKEIEKQIQPVKEELKKEVNQVGRQVKKQTVSLTRKSTRLFKGIKKKT